VSQHPAPQHQRRRKAVLGVLAATVVGLLAACGVTWGGSPTPDLRATAARQYQAATAKADTATKAFDDALGKLPNDASYSDVVPAARALLAAMTSFKDTVFPIAFPANMKADLRPFGIVITSMLQAQADFIANPSHSTFDTWRASEIAGLVAGNTIRRDLHLRVYLSSLVSAGTVSPAVAAQAYSAAEAEFATADDAWNAAVTKLPGGAPWSDFVPAARALYAAATAFEHALVDIPFPPSMVLDADATVSALYSELLAENDFISSPYTSTYDAWVSADAAAQSANNPLRHDLGLPPLSSTAA
jgi:hypothetical protein